MIGQALTIPKGAIFMRRVPENREFRVNANSAEILAICCAYRKYERL